MSRGSKHLTFLSGNTPVAPLSSGAFLAVALHDRRGYSKSRSC